MKIELTHLPNGARLTLILSLILIIGCRPSLPDDIKFAYQDLPEKVDFNFHIKPILADRCYKCHGPDDNTRQSDFRLDIEEKAFAKLKESGDHAFIKGNIGKSVAWKRITSEDPDYHMPPLESNLNLSGREIAFITKWIEQGAEWREHWAFIPPEKPAVPTVTSGEMTEGFPPGWEIRNPIDHFVLEKLKENELTPSPQADKERLIRRLSFDLTGLPPTIEEAEDFISDDSPQAYENLIDRLLSTDAYAERMAMEWLDVARYADTQGMHSDRERFSWPWRDWVIKAFKGNLPYDEFLTWQLAGDLLPNATKEQKLATAFHRNHPVSSEGGIIDEEFRQKYVQDRTNTSAVAFLGLTMECATCHDHKFDPVSQKEYYQMTAFFNNLKEVGMVVENSSSSGPVLLLPDPGTEKKLVKLSREINTTLEKMKLTRSEIATRKNYIQSIHARQVNPPTLDAFYPFENIRPAKIKSGGYIHRILNNSPIDQIVDNNYKSVASGEPQVVPGRFGNALRFNEEHDLVFLKDVGNFEINEPFSAGAWINTERAGENQSIMGTSSPHQEAWKGWDLFIDTLNRPSIRLTSSWPQNYMQVTAD